MNNIFFCDFIYLYLPTSETQVSAANRPRDMAYSNVAPIPLYKEQGSQKSYPDRSGSGQERHPPKSPKEFTPVFERRDMPGRGAGRPNSKPSGMTDPYGIDIAPRV